MPNYGGAAQGYLQFQRDQQQRQMQQAQLQQIMQALAASKMQQEQMQRQAAARMTAGQMLDQPGGGAPGAPQLPQPPMPGAPSQPMQPPQAGPAPGRPVQQNPESPGPDVSPYRTLPRPGAEPQAGGAQPDQLPPPPNRGEIAAKTVEPTGSRVQQYVDRLKKAGVPRDQWLDVIQAGMPIIQAQDQEEIRILKAQNDAIKTALDTFYKQAMVGVKGKEVEIKAQDVESKGARREAATAQGERRLDIMASKAGRAASQAAGGAGNLKSMEYLYPKGPDGKPDETKEPIGVRGLTKSGRVIVLDTEGRQSSMAALGGGATAKEGKDSKVKVTDTVRSNIVKAGVTNVTARLDELEKKYPDMSTSAFFGTHGENPLTRGAYGAGKSMMSGKQQEVDAQWASIIDEAIPVFTGGLRGSDAFRRFLIEQAPGPGDKPGTIRQKIDLIRRNVKGTSHAFFDKFTSDPQMWAPGTSKADIEAAKGGGTAAEGGLSADEQAELDRLRAKYRGRQ